MRAVPRRIAVAVVVSAAVAVALVVVAWIGVMWWDSRLPGTYNVMDHGTLELGGGAAIPHAHHRVDGGTTSVASLHGPHGRGPDASFTLTARRATIELPSGKEIEALTFDGRSPGPELRVRRGDLVQVTLVNEDVERGVTIHWHGVDVPNAEDGVAGVTQDAVEPGTRHVYRFQAKQVGTFWYHTHQVSSKEVRRGLFGALVIEPRERANDEVDRAVVVHTFDGIPTLDGNDGAQRLEIEPGTSVRLRLINTDNAPHRFLLGGTPFRVVALDGTDLNEPTEITDVALEVPGGGRIDVSFVVPSSSVWLRLLDTSAALAINGDPKARVLRFDAGEPTLFDPLTYGERAATPFDDTSSFDRRFELTISQKPGFLDGRPGRQWAINGGIFPDVPTFLVNEGDLVAVDIANETDADHPMHLHGHHVLVLSRNAEPASGSPWWADTLNVAPGDRYRVAFLADNPGIWMDHCHNLNHAADGLTMHVAYAGLTTPFTVGGVHGNAPE